MKKKLSADKKARPSTDKKARPQKKKSESAKEALKQIRTIVELDATDIPPGQIRRRVGDVFLYSKKEYIVEFVSPSRAVARCLARPKKEVDPETGEIKKEDPLPNLISISNCCDRGDVIRRVDNYQPIALQKAIPV